LQNPRIYTTKKIKEMKANRIKLFEDFQEQYTKENEVLEAVFLGWKNNLDLDLNSLYEDAVEVDVMEEPEYSRGEKAALARDFQIMTKPQLAALYLAALGLEEDESKGKYLIMIPGIEDFGSFDESRSFELTTPAFADAIGLESFGTVTRTINKFANLISGEGETVGEALYPKVVNAYNEFSRMNPTSIANIAAEALQDVSYTKNRDKAAEMMGKAAMKAQEKKQEMAKMGEKIFTLIKALKTNIAFADPKKAQKAAIMRIARETSMDPSKLEMALQKFLVSNNLASYYQKA
jgi:uncharacterized FlaG/YvyC family protein